MKHCKTLLFVIFCLFITSSFATKPVKVACVGNSITYGSGIQNRELNSYPAQLQVYLGEGYKVKNFGVSATTLLEKGNFPYRTTKQYKESLEFMPDIVFIKLGTNDSKPQNRIHLDEFKDDYLSLVNSYRELPSHPRVILLTPVRCFLEDQSGISDSVLQARITPQIKELAAAQDLEIVNMYYIFGNKWASHLMPDRLHPSSIGAGVMADKLYNYLSTPSTAQKKDIVSRFPLKAVKEFNFHGFKGYEYNHNGVGYKIVEPHQTAIGNPWIWRARFWGHEPQADIALLEKGFHLTYCNVGDLYGSDEAIKRWNRFYDLAVKAGLNEKVALEGMSRGGLIIYNWAAQNQEKTACIYADAPVLDFKSWPMGQKNGKRSDRDTEELLRAYGFKSEEEALKWTKNPVDQAKVLAKANIPLLHVVGDDDEVVPVSENTSLLEARLQEEGYTLTVIHKPGIKHHPHSLPNPEPIVRFILKATGYAENLCALPVCGNEYRSGAGWREGDDWHSVARDISETLSQKKIKLLMIGNSITQGLGGERKAVLYKPGKTYMDRAFGEGNWESAGISGDRTQHVIWRIRNGNYKAAQPEYAVITIGVNNVSFGDDPQDIAEGIFLATQEATLQLPNTRIITLGLLPAGKEADSKIRTKCDQVHKHLAAMTWGNVLYVNPTSWFTFDNGKLKTELYGGDHLHLSGKGYELWSLKIKELID